MLNGLQGKGFPQLNDPDLSPRRPPRNLEKFQGSSRQFVHRQSVRHRGNPNPGAYHALGDLGSTHLHEGPGLHRLRPKPLCDHGTRVGPSIPKKKSQPLRSSCLIRRRANRCARDPISTTLSGISARTLTPRGSASQPTKARSISPVR